MLVTKDLAVSTIIYWLWLVAAYIDDKAICRDLLYGLFLVN